MKNSLIPFSIICLLAFASCKKSTTTPIPASTYSLSYTLNGTTVSYPYCYVGYNNDIVITGSVALPAATITTSAAVPYFQLSIDQNVGSLAAGQTFVATAPGMDGPGGGVFYYSTGSNNLFNSEPGTQTSVTITEVTSDYIKGTFSAVLYPFGTTNLNTSAALTFTNGTFVAAKSIVVN